MTNVPASTLADHPVAAEWHPTRNGDLDPARITRGQHVRAWWLCGECGHEWQATVVARAHPTSPSGCPACASRSRSLKQAARGAERNPLSAHPVAAELHPTLNPGMNPTSVAAASRAHVWWRCGACAHVWRARVAHRTAKTGGGCPACKRANAADQATQVAAQRAALSSHPVASEWHPTLNGDLTPSQVPLGARQMVWWRCGACRHEWQTKATARTRQKNPVGCPRCAASAHGDELRGRTVMQRETVADRPDLLAEWHPNRNSAWDPAEITCGSKRKVWWRCAVGHEWEATVANRANRNRPGGCPGCAQERKAVAARAAAAARNPLTALPVAAEWHPVRNDRLDPSDFGAGSGERVWWLCATCGHEWQAAIVNRVQKTGCPQCARDSISSTKIAAAAARDPLSAHPVAVQWHPIRNGDLSPSALGASSHIAVWWLCDVCGCEWQINPKQRTRRDRPSGCPDCGARRAGEATSRRRSGTATVQG